MHGSLQTLSHEPLVLQAELPAGFSGVRLPGGTVISATGEFGNLCIQYYTGKHYSFAYSVLDIVQRFILQCRLNKKGLFARVVLQNTGKHSINDSEEILIREGQFLMLQGINPRAKVTFETPQIYQHFDAYFSPRIMKEVLPLFPEAEKMFKSEKSIITPAKRADTETRGLINSILQCHYENEMRRYFFESRVRDLLFQLLVQLSKKEPGSGQPSESEIEAVYAAEEIISGDLTQHFRIPELSKKVHLNEFRFKIVFKKIFGTGPYEYLQHKRLARAKELIESGLPIKAAAAETGYRLTHFITVFREHYGFTPGSIKRNLR